MKFYVSADIEGMSGYGHEAAPLADAEIMRAHMVATAEGLRAGGADVTLSSFHGYPDGLPEFINVLRARPKPKDQFDLPWFSDEFAGLVMLGFHGTRPGWSFGHSYKFAHLVLNGRQCGEVTVQMMLAASLGVPTVLMIGDMGGVTEAREVAPDILTVLTRPAKAGDEGPLDPLILDEVRRAAEKCVRHRIAPPVVPATLTLGVPFRTDLGAKNASELPYPVVREGRLVSRRADNFADVYRFLLDCFDCVIRARKVEGMEQQ